MKGALVDSSVILDVFLDDPQWGDWSESALTRLSGTRSLLINPIIYTEISIGFERIEEVEALFQTLGFSMKPIPREALFLAGKAFLQYKRRKGEKGNVLPDFFIGAHAAVSGYQLISRDKGRFSTYFPSVHLIIPESTNGLN